MGFGANEQGRYTWNHTENDARIISGFTDAETIINESKNIVAVGDTPIAAGLNLVNEVLDPNGIYGATAGAKRVVVVLCDGSFQNSSDAMTAATGLNLGDGDVYYGISLDNGNNRLWRNDMERLKSTVENSHSGVDAYNVEVTSDNLTDAFMELVNLIDDTYYEYVRDGHMTDVLSSAMDFADDKYDLAVSTPDGPHTLEQNPDGSFQLPVTELNPNGGTVTVVKKNENGKESIELIFSDGYQMESLWKFELSAYLRVNPQFAATYDGHIDGKSNAGTGTYQLKDGVWTNANLESVFTFVQSYDAEGNPVTKTLQLQKPVIQLNAVAVAPASAPESYEASDETQDAVYLAPEAPEVLGVTREEVVNEEEPMVLGARRNARTGDLTGLIQAACFAMSGITFALSRKKEDDAA